MRRIYCTLIVISSLIGVLHSQQTEYYSIESALLNKEIAKTLVLNLNDTRISPSLEAIGELENLEELIVFPVSIHGPFRFRLMDDWKTDSLDNGVRLIPIESYYDTAIAHIPEEIGNCKGLRVLSISMGEVRHLPLTLTKLSKLEILELSGNNFPESELIEILKPLENLKVLEIVDCRLSEDGIVTLLSKFPRCQILTTFQEYQKFTYQGDIKHRVFVEKHDMAIAFSSEKEALQFLNSLPVEMIMELGISYKWY